MIEFDDDENNIGDCNNCNDGNNGDNDNDNNSVNKKILLSNIKILFFGLKIKFTTFFLNLENEYKNILKIILTSFLLNTFYFRNYI